MLNQEAKKQIFLLMQGDKITDFSKSKILDKIFELDLDQIKFNDCGKTEREKAVFIKHLCDKSVWLKLTDPGISILERKQLISLLYLLVRKPGEIDLAEIEKLKEPLISKFLMLAVVFNHNEVFKAIINSQPELIYIKDEDGNSLLNLAAINHSNEIAEILIKKDFLSLMECNLSKTVSLSIEYGNIEMIKNLPRSRIKLKNYRDEQGFSPLMQAIECDQPDIAELLINDGALATIDDLNLQENYGNTALMLAIAYNQTKIASDLIKDPRINLNQQNNQGDTALMLAIEYNQTEIAIALIKDRRSNLNLANKKGWTPLMLAIAYNRTEIAIALITSGKIDLNQQNNDGNTALMVAIENKQPNRAITQLIKNKQKSIKPL